VSVTTDRDLLRRGGAADLSARVKLLIAGADRVRYLNGQVTANVQTLKPGETLPACVTTAKGRLCAEIMVAATPDALVIDADPSLHETLAPRLERYIIADDVTVSDVTREWGLIHLVLQDSETVESVSRPGFESVEYRRSRRFGRDGIDFFLPANETSALLNTLSARHLILDESLLETLRIEAGIPRWGRELDENTLPPEAGLERTHIDYHKGCYVGQEVISRLKSVGHVNRRLVGFLSTTGAPLSPGFGVFPTGDSALLAGTITSATWSFTLEKPIALGYLKRSAPAGDLIARALDSPGEAVPIAVRELPFVS
jgi:tRNA-modifying protein YgfZ